MANSTGKAVDSTYLGFIDYASTRLFIHRDYLAHCLRFSHIARYLLQGAKYKTAHMLDIGCGREAPLPRLMYSMKMTHTTGSYTGADYGPIPWPEHISKKSGKFKAEFLEGADFAIVDLPRKSFDLITCFEMLEHVEPEHAFAMMRRMTQVLAKDGTCFLSTPCYDPKTGAANNHVNEMSYEGFEALILLAGFEIVQSWGTFASQKDYKQKFFDDYPAGEELFTKLSEYYDSNIVACLFAPLYPRQARNCIWQLKRSPRPPAPFAFQGLEYLSNPKHGSSDSWPKAIRNINAHVVKERKNA